MWCRMRLHGGVKGYGLNNPQMENKQSFGVTRFPKALERRWNWTGDYGYTLLMVRGKGIVSRICLMPVSQETVRSTPMPKPECGTLP